MMFDEKFTKWIQTKIYNISYRARCVGVANTLTVAELSNLYISFNGVCPDCNQSYPITKIVPDHIVALSNGGANSIENIRLCCSKCNSRKGSKEIKSRFHKGIYS